MRNSRPHAAPTRDEAGSVPPQRGIVCRTRGRDADDASAVPDLLHGGRRGGGRTMNVAEIMTRKIVTVELGDRLSTVKEIFDRSKIHHLLAVEDGKLYGVISDRDLLKALSPALGTVSETYKDRAALNRQVHQIMTRKPITLPPDAPLADAIELLLTRNISCIAIADAEQRPLGIVTWRDALKALAGSS
jgi:acetoin utilization protein AcuB